MEDQTYRVRHRFRSMLDSAELAAESAAKDRPSVLQPSSLMVAAVKAMNRAGGFLEAVSIVFPELGRELLDEFENSATRVGAMFQASERRMAGGHPSASDRRAGERRLGYDRRRHSMKVAVERRHTRSRRAEPDRRTSKIRELADRRWRAVRG